MGLESGDCKSSILDRVDTGLSNGMNLESTDRGDLAEFTLRIDDGAEFTLVFEYSLFKRLPTNGMKGLRLGSGRGIE